MYMNVTRAFFVVAAILFALAGLGAGLGTIQLIPWGLFFVALGLAI
jgi:hypothetical protein